MSRSKSKSKKRCSSKSEACSVTDDDVRQHPQTIEPGHVFIDLGVTNCAICGGSDHDDAVLLCDGEGCKNEIHMFCLCPPITAVPNGDWLCPACDPDGTSLYLDRELSKYESDFNTARDELKFTDGCVYSQWRRERQQQHYPIDQWRPNWLSDDFWIPAEFEEESVDLIGSIVRVYSSVDDQTHTGRILARRWNCFTDKDKVIDPYSSSPSSSSSSSSSSWSSDESNKCSAGPTMDTASAESAHDKNSTDVCSRWEHLVHFRRGGDGRNRDVIKWVCLQEIPCSVGGPVVWAKVQGSPWWPAQVMLRSGIELIRTKERNAFGGFENNNSPLTSSQPSTSSSSSSCTSKPASDTVTASSLSVLGITGLSGAALTSRVLVRFFLDGSVSMMTPEQATVSLMPFSERPRELRGGMSKVNISVNIHIIRVS
jgi:PHD-finger/PWWP domain